MSLSLARRKEQVEPGHDRLSISRQCQLLSLQRSAYYYQPVAEKPQNLELMRQIDEQHLKTPWYGARQMTRQLCREGHKVNRKRIRRLMHMIGLSAIYQKPNTSRPHPQHKVYPYLLRGLTIEQPNQVWCADISYIPVRHGFFYLVAILDWASRKVLSWRLSNTLDSDFCVAALEESLQRYGRPDIFNTDQGSQFTSDAFTTVLHEAGVRLSMDGRGRWRDNVRIERFWRSLKYECIYLQAFETASEVRQELKRWITYYNVERPHSSLDDRTPHEAYWQKPRPGSVAPDISLAA